MSVLRTNGPLVMMTYQHAKGFVGTRGNNVQKIVFCFLICSIHIVAVLAQKYSHTCIEMGTMN